MHPRLLSSSCRTFRLRLGNFSSAQQKNPHAVMDLFNREQRLNLESFQPFWWIRKSVWSSVVHVKERTQAKKFKVRSEAFSEPTLFIKQVNSEKTFELLLSFSLWWTMRETFFLLRLYSVCFTSQALIGWPHLGTCAYFRLPWVTVIKTS